MRLEPLDHSRETLNIGCSLRGSNPWPWTHKIQILTNWTKGARWTQIGLDPYIHRTHCLSGLRKKTFFITFWAFFGFSMVSILFAWMLFASILFASMLSGSGLHGMLWLLWLQGLLRLRRKGQHVHGLMQRGAQRARISAVHLQPFQWPQRLNARDGGRFGHQHQAEFGMSRLVIIGRHGHQVLDQHRFLVRLELHLKRLGFGGWIWIWFGFVAFVLPEQHPAGCGLVRGLLHHAQAPSGGFHFQNKGSGCWVWVARHFAWVVCWIWLGCLLVVLIGFGLVDSIFF